MLLKPPGTAVDTASKVLEMELAELVDRSLGLGGYPGQHRSDFSLRQSTRVSGLPLRERRATGSDQARPGGLRHRHRLDLPRAELLHVQRDLLGDAARLGNDRADASGESRRDSRTAGAGADDDRAAPRRPRQELRMNPGTCSSAELS